MELVPARFAAWMELLRMAQQEQSTMKVQLFFVMPIVVGIFALAWATHYGFEKPWARVLHVVSEQWPKFLLYFVSAGYFAMNIGLWYSTGFSWSQKGLPVYGDLCLQYGHLAEAFNAFGSAMKLREPKTARLAFKRVEALREHDLLGAMGLAFARYLPPEGWHVPRSGGMAADIFALGLVLLEVLDASGIPNPECKNLQQLSAKMLPKRGQWQPQVKKGPYDELPLKTRQVIESCFSPNPKQRPSAQELLFSLAAPKEDVDASWYLKEPSMLLSSMSDGMKSGSTGTGSARSQDLEVDLAADLPEAWVPLDKPTPAADATDKKAVGPWSEWMCADDSPPAVLWAEDREDTFLTGSALRRFGQNTAAEYWVARDKGNYRKLTYGETTFWVLRSEQVEETLPADNVVSEKMATLLVTAILEGGPKLETVMEDLSVLQPKVPKVSLKQLQASFGSHAIVIQGELDLDNLPTRKKPGRKRAGAGTSQEGNAKHQKTDVTPALQTVRLQIFLSTTGAIHAQRRRVAGSKSGRLLLDGRRPSRDGCHTTICPSPNPAVCFAPW
eukprot:symbB.v1.2.023576.t1/scaffold2167.1/size87172/3